jgi:zinc-dependent metalloproteinase lipoprotein
MKKEFLLTLAIAAFLFSACKSSDDPTLTVATATYTVPAAGETLSVKIASNTSWTAASNADWCVPSSTSGEGDYTLPIAVSANSAAKTRSAMVTLGFNSNQTAPLTINQEAAEPSLTVPTNSYNVAYNDNSLVFTVTSNGDWTASSNQSWCTPKLLVANGTQQLAIAIDGNTTTSARSANVTVALSSGAIKQVVAVNQAAGLTAETYHYKIPVVFHVLYKTNTSATQYPKTGWLKTLITAVNKLYTDNNMNLEFEMAAYDNNGKVLTEPGVDRQQVTTDSIDCSKFMDGKDTNNSKWLGMLWDLNKYINIYLYKFSSDDSGYVTMGITHMPYVNSDYYKDGENKGSLSWKTSDFPFPHCVSINNLYINEYDPTSKYYDPMDVVVTLAHELGHYIDLYHVFTETDEDACKGNDYCDDTPNYDRNTYEKWLTDYIAQRKSAGTLDKVTLSDLIPRTSCSDGTTFNGDNIMDYEYCKSNKFTTNQKERTRFILNYGILMPGPKLYTVSTSSMKSRSSFAIPANPVYKTLNAKKSIVSETTSSRMRIR